MVGIGSLGLIAVRMKFLSGFIPALSTHCLEVVIHMVCKAQSGSADNRVRLEVQDLEGEGMTNVVFKADESAKYFVCLITTCVVAIILLAS